MRANVCALQIALHSRSARNSPAVRMGVQWVEYESERLVGMSWREYV